MAGRPFRRGLPRPSFTDPAVQAWAEGVTEALELLQGSSGRGNQLDRALRARDLAGAEFAQAVFRAPSAATTAVAAVQTPPQPSGFSGTTAKSAITLFWSDPYRAYIGHDITLIYRGDTDDFDAAQQVGISRTSFYVDVGVVVRDAPYWYWIVWQNTRGAKGPLSGGIELEALQSSGDLIGILDDVIGEDQLTDDLLSKILTLGTNVQTAFDLIQGNEDSFDIVTSRVNDLSSSYTDLNAGVGLQSSAISGLVAAINHDDTGLVALSGVLDMVEAALTDEDGVLAEAQAFDGLVTRVEEGFGASSEQETLLRSLALGESGAETEATLLNRYVTEARSDGTGFSRWLLKTKVNELVGGIGLYNDGNSVRFTVSADRFAIMGNDTGAYIGSPFIVVTTPDTMSVPGVTIQPGVYIKRAYIRDAEIDSLKIRGNAVTVPAFSVTNYPGTPLRAFEDPPYYNQSAIDPNKDSSSPTVPQPFVNTAPVASNNIANVVLPTTTSEATINLTQYFSDADQEPSTLLYSVASSNENATFSIGSNGYSLTITGVQEGTAVITVTARDHSNAQASQTFTVTVPGAPSPVNSPPTTVLAIDNQTLTVGGPTLAIGTAAFFNDPDVGDTLTYSVSGGSGVATVTINPSTGTLNISPTSVGSNHLITVTAMDNGSPPLSATQSFRLTVQAAVPPPTPNMPPTFNPFAQRTVDIGGPDLSVGLAGPFTDPDGDSLGFVLQGVSQPSRASVTVTGSTASITGLTPGDTNVTIRATDGGGLGVNGTFSVRVRGALSASLSLVGGDPNVGENGSRLIDCIVTGPVTQGVGFNWSKSSNLPGTIVAISGQQFRARYTPGQVSSNIAGTISCQVSSDFAHNDPTASVGVTAVDTTPANRAPVVANPIANRTLAIAVMASISLAGVFSDPDGDDLTYSVTSGSGVAASISGTTLSITGIVSGSWTVTVTATDEIEMVSDTFVVTVASGPIP